MKLKINMKIIEFLLKKSIYKWKQSNDMKREKILTDSLTIRISEKLNDEYKNYCDDNGLSLSKRLRFFMKKDIEGKLNIKK